MVSRFSFLCYFFPSAFCQAPAVADIECSADGMGLWSWDDEVLDGAVSDSHAGYPVPRIASLTAASYFHGISWMGIPQSRQAILTPPQPLPGGLLGGGEGPKLSKLQALAAARKKKTDVKKDDDKVDRAEKRMSSLAITEPSSKESGSGLLAKRQKLSGESTPQPSATSQLRTSSSDAPSGMDVDLAQETPAGNDELTQDDCFVVPSTRPSAFAQTLFGPSQDSADASQTYNMPYTTSSSFVPSAFTQPSPDDIVLAAQAKGSRFATTQ